MSRPMLALLSVLALVLTACPAEDPDEEPTPPPDDTVTWASCTNPAAGYTVEYPPDWHTNEANHLDACQVFDPEPIDLPDQPQHLPVDLGVIISVEPVAFAEATAEDMGVDVVAEQEQEIDGRTALRQELVATGEGLYPEGTEYTRYAVDRDGQTLVAQSFNLGEPAYAEKVEVLDEMMTTLRFDDPAEPGDPAEPPPADPPTDDTTVEPLTDERAVETRTDDGGGTMLTVTDVRLGAHEGFDRIVFEIAGEGPAGWHVHYVDQPVTQGEGAPVDIAGEAFLEIIIRGVALPPDVPDQQPWDGQRLPGPEGAQVMELVDDGIFEGQHVFHVGLPAESAFGVVRLDDPQRVVVEIEHG